MCVRNLAELDCSPRELLQQLRMEIIIYIYSLGDTWLFGRGYYTGTKFFRVIAIYIEANGIVPVQLAEVVVGVHVARLGLNRRQEVLLRLIAGC